jgi:hypothetical protein
MKKTCHFDVGCKGMPVGSVETPILLGSDVLKFVKNLSGNKSADVRDL